MLAAFIKDNKVVLVQDVNDQQYSAMMKDYQAGIDITNFNPTPGVGWLMRGSRLVPDTANQVEYVAVTVVDPAIKFRDATMRWFLAENIFSGITASGKTRYIGNRCRELQYWMNICSFYEVLAEIENLKRTLTPEDYPYLTLDRLEDLKFKVLRFLGKA